MITEANYVELMKNCSKWNARTCSERKTRFRYPFYDQQTGTAHRPVQNYYKRPEQRYRSDDNNIYIQYSAPRWKKRDHQPSDAVEMKMFLRDNPALDAAVNQTSQMAAPIPEVSISDVSADLAMSSRGTPKQNAFEEFTDDLDDDLISNGSGSDEDDWGSKRKKGKNATTKKKKNAGRSTKASRV